jgi:hypothetical protein
MTSDQNIVSIERGNGRAQRELAKEMWRAR